MICPDLYCHIVGLLTFLFLSCGLVSGLIIATHNWDCILGDFSQSLVCCGYKTRTIIWSRIERTCVCSVHGTTRTKQLRAPLTTTPVSEKYAVQISTQVRVRLIVDWIIVPFPFPGFTYDLIIFLKGILWDRRWIAPSIYWHFSPNILVRSANASKTCRDFNTLQVY